MKVISFMEIPHLEKVVYVQASYSSGRDNGSTHDFKMYCLSWIPRGKIILNYLINFIQKCYVYRSLARDTVYNTVSWPNPKQWLMVHKLKTHSPIYCIKIIERI